MSKSRQWHSSVGKLTKSTLNADINVTPLVDVCLVLLIIFMVVTPMLQAGVELIVPQAAHAEKKPGGEGGLVIPLKQGRTPFVRHNTNPSKSHTTDHYTDNHGDPELTG